MKLKKRSEGDTSWTVSLLYVPYVVRLKYILSINLFPGILILLTQQYEFSSGRKYDRNRQGLREVPTNIPADAEEVDLANNRISRVETNSFSHLSQCVKLSLSNNEITQIEPEAFNGLTSLTYLNISHNDLTHLSGSMFSGLVSFLFFHIYCTNSILDPFCNRPSFFFSSFRNASYVQKDVSLSVSHERPNI